MNPPYKTFKLIDSIDVTVRCATGYHRIQVAMTDANPAHMFRIIYLHGFASGPQSKKAQLFRERFAALGSQVDIPDLAEGDFENLTISGQLRVIERIAGGRPAILIGSSLGGYLAALYASLHPETARLVLLAPAFGFTRLWPQSLGAKTMEEWKRTGSRPVFHYGEGRERRLNYKIVEDGRQYPDFPDFHQPALIFHGAGDTVVPIALSEQFASGHPNVRLHAMDSDHELMSAVEEILRVSVEFLAE
jgi:pimeloyl-ACP methyl ester carboxylesterase